MKCQVLGTGTRRNKYFLGTRIFNKKSLEIRMPRARSLRQFCQVPVWPDRSCYRQFLKQEDSRGDNMRIDKARLLLARPGIPTFLFPLKFLAINNFLLSLYLRFLVVFSTIWQQWTWHGCPPPPTSCDGRKRGLSCHFQKQEENRSFLPAQGLARGWGPWLQHIRSMGPNLLVPSCQLHVSTP